jgi:hypothetical protein
MLIIQIFIHSCCYQANSQIFNGFVFKNGMLLWRGYSSSFDSKKAVPAPSQQTTGEAVKRERQNDEKEDPERKRFIKKTQKNIILFFY